MVALYLFKDYYMYNINDEVYGIVDDETGDFFDLHFAIKDKHYLNVQKFIVEKIKNITSSDLSWNEYNICYENNKDDSYEDIKEIFLFKTKQEAENKIEELYNASLSKMAEVNKKLAEAAILIGEARSNIEDMGFMTGWDEGNNFKDYYHYLDKNFCIEVEEMGWNASSNFC